MPTLLPKPTMTVARWVAVLFFAALGLATNVPKCWGQPPSPLPPIQRRIPPAGIELDKQLQTTLASSLADKQAQLAQLGAHPLRADVAVLLKAVAFALELNEFYAPQDANKAKRLLELAQQRLSQLQHDRAPWTRDTGRIVRGYDSKIDGSPQAYGLEIPSDMDLSKPAPLYVWLHGRGDKTTDLHFIHQCLTRPGTIKVDNAIVVHPFGRHCIGFKSAGEIDVLEVLEHVQSQYAIDPDRIVLMGFSMGGAGAWHLGAHYTDRWVALSPGAGFAETAQYNRLNPSDYPPPYEQTLWRLYDVPNYARNLLNLPVIAYSGENDKQIQAALVMEQALAEQGHVLNHVIGPGMGHQYHPDALANILSQLDAAVQQGLDRQPARLSLQTQTLRYSRLHGIEITGLEQHWTDTRVDANYQNQQWHLTTRNVRELRIHDPRPCTSLVIDGQTLEVANNERPLSVVRHAQQSWQVGESDPTEIRKRPGLQGPIDDAWLDAFLVVKPGTPSTNPALQAWIDFELDHLQDRWQALFRAKLPMKLDTEVTAEDIRTRHLILWGDPACNRILARISDRLPVTWSEQQLRIGPHEVAAAHHVPALIYPNPESPTRYVVLNSGPTFREAHDRTNSLQNPKLPDWAIIDIAQPPDDSAPGKIIAADFFDEAWQIKP